jgi:polyisoprenoid-binding protein YceI
VHLRPGTHALGPDAGTLTVRTGRSGAIAKVGHDLLLEVTRWSATVDAGERTAVELTADARSLRVRKGSGGMSPLGDDEKAGIVQSIDDDVLKGTAIAFRSNAVAVDGDELRVAGELELAGVRRPLEFALTLRDGRLRGSAQVKQTDWRMKPFSTLFGTLKVADVVDVAIDVAVPELEATGTRSDHDG